ncbi:unnamed protein product [Rhizophagus irregularis]|nr:unnamed protein product [Rhizophagus irregularis]
MDDGFVESKDLKEPIIGIQDDSWSFITAQDDVTQNSDKDYGYEPIPRWIEENLKSLLGTIALNIVLLLIAYWKKTFAIYTCGNAIEKFVTTILFTSIDADSVENIFTAR